jgi:hypothetical protein
MPEAQVPDPNGSRPIHYVGLVPVSKPASDTDASSRYDANRKLILLRQADERRNTKAKRWWGS